MTKNPDIWGNRPDKLKKNKSGIFDTGKQCQSQAWQGYDRTFSDFGD